MDRALPGAMASELLYRPQASETGKESRTWEIDLGYLETLGHEQLGKAQVFYLFWPQRLYDPTSRLVEEHRSTQDVSLCDIGSGIGSVAQAFLNYDAITVDVVESSSAYINASQEEASHQGNRSRIAYHHGDYVHLAHELGPRDLMCLDRVICCYPNMDSLVGLSAMNTKSLLAIVIPRDSIFHRALMKSLYLSFKIWGIFRTSPVVPRFYVHRITDIEDTIKWCGLDRLASKTTFFWRIALYQRSQP